VSACASEVRVPSREARKSAFFLTFPPNFPWHSDAKKNRNFRAPVEIQTARLILCDFVILVDQFDHVSLGSELSR